MFRFLYYHTPVTACKRLVRLVRGLGVLQTAGMLASVIDDNYLRCFDRRYRVRTSGSIHLASTSVDRVRLRDATTYNSPVNGWAFRRFLLRLNLPRDTHFVDLGCGLGRACLLAAEYGFRKVTGVEFVPEFCAVARENVASCRLLPAQISSVSILQMDAFDFCENTDADVFFMFRPFSIEFLSRILKKLAARAIIQEKRLTIIYSERVLLPMSHKQIFAENNAFQKIYEVGILGQAFYVYQCGDRSSGPPVAVDSGSAVG